MEPETYRDAVTAWYPYVLKMSTVDKYKIISRPEQTSDFTLVFILKR
jgi:hypothetical protein